MKQSEEHPSWFVWLYVNGPRLFLIVGTLIFILIVGIGLYFDSRLARIEDRFANVPPRSYQAPNLDDYRADDIAFEKLPVRRVVYVPAYSHVYYQGGSPYLLETTLSIRNVARAQPIYLKSVEYFDTNGKLVREYIDRPIKLNPLQTIEFLVERRDSSGGSGANFLVEWMANKGVDKPLIETVMVGAAARGISFSRTGIEVSSPSGASIDLK